MVQVTLWGGLVPLAENQKTLTVEADTIRELLRKPQERYPGLSGPIKNDVAVAVDGVIARDDRPQQIHQGEAVSLWCALAGG